MSRAQFVLVKGGHLHRNPAYEDCNVDDAGVINRYRSLDDVPDKAVACSKCKPRGEEPEDLATVGVESETEPGSEPTPTAPEVAPEPASPTETPEEAEPKAAAKNK